MPSSREPPDVSDLAPWIEWERVVERVRKAKSQDAAVLLLKRHLRAGLEFNASIAKSRQLTEAVRRDEQNKAHSRVDAMARAMATVDPHLPDHDYLTDAARLDAALRIRKQYEV
jgi:hypothetical protein